MEKKSARILEQEWIYDPQFSLHVLPNGTCRNADIEFSKYCECFYLDLLKLKTYYEDDFNQISKVTISEYISLFNQAFSGYFNLVIDDLKLRNHSPYPKQDEEKLDSLWNKTTRFELIQFAFNLKFIKNDLLELLEPAYLPYINTYMPTVMRFKDHIYPKIKKSADIIFELEEIISITTKKLWAQVVLNDVENFDKAKPYGLFVKVLSDWRKNNGDIDTTEFTQKRYTTSVSYITHNKSRFFRQHISPDELVGLVYSDDGFMCAKDRDAFLEEYIDGKCDYEEKSVFSKVMRIAQFGTHDIFSVATKIVAPRCSLNYNDNFNEIILDKRKSKPIAVFYVSKINGVDVNKNNKTFKLAQKLAIKFGLPIIELESKNNLFECENEQKNEE